MAQITSIFSRVPNAVFDATHGQPNWAQAGCSSREMDGSLVGLMETLCRLGCRCLKTGQEPLSTYLRHARLIILPPPTGCYDPRKQRWVGHPRSLLTAGEVQALLTFLRSGGRLLAFAYRFGDSFTGTNLGDLFSPLGCLLNDDVVIDLLSLRGTQRLQEGFDTPQSSLPLPWSREGIVTVRWRTMATFTLLPGTSVQPLVLSPGGRCISFNRSHRTINFTSLPIAVAGVYGEGRFALFGGPHAMELSPFGFYDAADNARFAQNVLRWLLDDGPASLEPVSRADELQTASLLHQEQDWGSMDEGRQGHRTVAYVERLLRNSGVLQACDRAKWMP